MLTLVLGCVLVVLNSFIGTADLHDGKSSTGIATWIICTGLGAGLAFAIIGNFLWQSGRKIHRAVPGPSSP